MTHRISAAIVRVLRNEQETVHFHSGPDGPYVCERPSCTSPSLHPRDF
jgi:hypothetical protein